MSTSTHPFLSPLIEEVIEATSRLESSADLVTACAPCLSRLIERDPKGVERFVESLSWPEEGDEHYHRQRVAEAEDGSWSIYAITWLPGQYTPIHDHGTWGVVSVLKGKLYEHQMARLDEGGDEEIDLVSAGVCLLTQGAINSFIPEPDHIHYTGIPLEESPTASLHLYGRLMTQYHAYDLETRTRYPLDVE
jgi:3-mercaptopropionate dioxygenase